MIVKLRDDCDIERAVSAVRAVRETAASFGPMIEAGRVGVEVRGDGNLRSGRMFLRNESGMAGAGRMEGRETA